MKEIVFEVQEDLVDGGYSASALEFGIHSHGESVEELRRNVREAVDSYFEEADFPGVIRFHYVGDEEFA